MIGSATHRSDADGAVNQPPVGVRITKTTPVNTGRKVVQVAPAPKQGETAKRLNFALPPEYGPMLDQVGTRISAAVKEVAGVAFVPSRVDIVRSLIEDAAAEQANGATSAGE